MKALLIAILSVTTPLLASPRTPSDEQEVLERLRTGPEDPGLKEARELRTRLRKNPNDLSLALSLARRYLDLGRASSDPRFVGRAESALGPWWATQDAPEPVLLLRATIRQYLHDFPGSLSDLARALAAHPEDVQAWVTRAAVQQVLGDFGAARISCFEVLQRASRLPGTTCLAGVSSLTGQLERSRALLARTLQTDDRGDHAEELWAQTTLAEMAVRAGDAHSAESAYRAALALGVKDGYLLASYSDFLLDQGRAAEVVTLLQDETRADNLLLRLTLAERVSGAPLAAAHEAQLGERFAASALRGERLHLREESRFALGLAHDRKRALLLASQNWNVQHEPADVRVLLEAAAAADDRAAAGPALLFLKQSGLEDATLTPLRTKLERP